MSITPQDARKQMLTVVNSIWQAESAAIVGYVPELRYQGLEKGNPPGTSKYWARVSITTVTTRQRGHRTVEPGVSQPVYDTFGFITLQVYAPMTSPTAWANGELLSELGQAMFMARETEGAVWFRNPRIVTLDNDGTSFRWNVIADFQYTQTRLPVDDPLVGGELVWQEESW